MLESLTIQNTAIIDFLNVNFGEGMNCMTGETGAGKSIIVDSLCCLLGERVSKESIRTGADEARVTGVFSVLGERAEKINAVLEELGIEPEDDGTIILYRSWNVSGRTVCRINDRVVTLSALKKLGEVLVDVHGQHDNHALLSVSSHGRLLDLFAGVKMTDLLAEYREKLAHLGEIEEELSEIGGDPKKRAQTIDLLSFQTEEIFNANLKPGEEKDLEEAQKIFDNQENISKALTASLSMLESGFDDETKTAEDLISESLEKLSRIENFSEDYKCAADKLREASFALADAVETVRDLADDMNFDPREADRVAERLDLIYDLKRKYGQTVEEIIAFGEDAQNRLEKLQKSEALVEKLNKEKKATVSELFRLSEHISELRKAVSETLCDGVHKNLADMEMGKVRFSVSIEMRDPGDNGENFDKNGLDRVEFLIATNPGEPMKPLSKIASGGELSRIMLAIKSVLADVDDIPVLVFDEIDTGISGAAAGKVAEKFAALGKNHEVICISHLAQIAAIADNNIFVSKVYTDNSATTEVRMLDDEEKIDEIARLMDGDGVATDLTRAHAKELIARMRVKKS